MNFYQNGELVAQVPPSSLVLGGGAPIYDRAYSEPAYFNTYKQFKIDSVVEPENLKDVAKFLFQQPNIASKRWVYEQFDSHVMADTIAGPGGDAALVRVHGSQRGLAITTDCTPRYVEAEPETGGKQAVAEAYRNICAIGARPLAITNNLNFGNPEKPEIMGQVVLAIKGIAEAAEKLEMPIVSGNVSLYNETDGEPILPTPTIGAVGLINEDEEPILNSVIPQFNDPGY